VSLQNTNWFSSSNKMETNIGGKKMVRLISFVAVLMLFGAVFGDVVTLRNGHRLEGEVVELNGQIEVKMRFGSIFVKKEDVVRIERSLTPWQDFERRLKTIREDDYDSYRALIAWCKEKELDEESERVKKMLEKALRSEYNRRRERAGKDIEEVRRIAYWCEEVGLRSEYEETMSFYWKLRVEASLKEVDRTDAKALVTLAIRLREDGVPETYLRVLFEMALLQDPDCFQARISLGMQFWEGHWLFKSQVDAILKQREEERLASSGYVYVNGKWVRPDAYALIEKEGTLLRLEESLKIETSKLRIWEQDLRQREANFEAEKNRFESEKRRYEYDLQLKDSVIRELRCENFRLVREVRELRDENHNLRDENDKLRREIERLRRELEDAKRNSGSSSSPSPSTGPRSERRQR